MAANLLLLAVVSLAWSAGYLFMGTASHGLPPVTATAAMCGIAAAAMVPAVPLLLRRPLLPVLRRRPWVPVMMAFTAVALPNLAVVYAERTVPPELASVLGTSVPLATLLLTTFVTRETRLSAVRLLGVAVAVAGLVVFAGWGELLDDDAELQGILVMLAGGLLFAINGILVKRHTRDLDGAALATWTMLFAAPVLALAAWLLESPTRDELSRTVVDSLLAEGLLGMALAYLVYYVLVERAGAWFASLYAFLVPPLGVLLAAAVHGGVLTPRHLLGVGVVLTGLALVSRGETARSPVR